MSRIVPRLALLVTVVLTMAGCGSTAPVDEVPDLANRLGEIDQALVEGDFPAARDDLDALVETTTVARDEGALTRREAATILEAAVRLAGALPREQSNPDPDDPDEPDDPDTPVTTGDDNSKGKGAKGAGKGKSGKGEGKGKGNKGGSAGKGGKGK